MSGIELVGQPFDNFIAGCGTVCCGLPTACAEFYAFGESALELASCLTGEIELFGDPVLNNLAVGTGVMIATLCPCTYCVMCPIDGILTCYMSGGWTQDILGAFGMSL
jgi:threonine dehydrogenase-like Zn-dependent dehydrogenase